MLAAIIAGITMAKSKKDLQTTTYTKTAKALFLNFARQPVVHKTWLWLVAPALIYATAFFAMQPHYLGNFSNGFYLDNGDGFQNVWNIWWVNHAIVEENTNPYFTNMLHWPHGTSLLPQTMNIINGLMAIPLVNLFGFSLVQAVNFFVIFSFVFGGITMFWFIQKLYGEYWVSILAGALFTFSSYHFAHAQGHLQLVSLEFIPLFLLAFWSLLEKVRYRYALLAAGALFLVLLSDYYYFFWSVIVAAMWLGWQTWKREFKLSKQNLRVLTMFGIAALALNGPIVFSLLRLNKHDPLLGSHDPTAFGLDPLSVIIPGGSWYWHTLTEWHTKHLAYFAEASVFFGFGLITLLIIAFIKRFIKKKHDALEQIGFWWVTLVVFGILALGPRLKTLEQTLQIVPLPYAFLERIFPTLQISGMPIRWILISLLAAIVIGSGLLAHVDVRRRKGLIFVAIIVLVSLVDLWPRQLPLTPPTYQPYVYFLKQQPNGGVIDNGALSGSEQLYNQTLHHKPIAFGYVTRLPKSVDTKDFLIFAALEEKRYDHLCRDYEIRYVTLPSERPLKDIQYPIIYNDYRTIIYDLKNSPNC